MSVSVPATPRHRLRDILFCASLGCLCFIRRWFDLEILQVRGLDFYRSGPRDPTLLAATLLSSSILGLVFWLLAQWVRRADNPRLTAAARCVTLLVIVYSIQCTARSCNPNAELPVPPVQFGHLLTIDFARRTPHERTIRKDP
jgi:hypothetical protein